MLTMYDFYPSTCDEGNVVRTVKLNYKEAHHVPVRGKSIYRVGVCQRSTWAFNQVRDARTCVKGFRASKYGVGVEFGLRRWCESSLKRRLCECS